MAQEGENRHSYEIRNRHAANKDCDRRSTLARVGQARAHYCARPEECSVGKAGDEARSEQATVVWRQRHKSVADGYHRRQQQHQPPQGQTAQENEHRRSDGNTCGIGGNQMPRLTYAYAQVCGDIVQDAHHPELDDAKGEGAEGKRQQ